MTRVSCFTLGVLLLAGLPPVAAAQYGPSVTPGLGGIGLNVPVQTKTINADIVEISKRGLVIEREGQPMPVPMDRQTEIRIEGEGDPGFVQPGVIMNVWGKLKPDLTVIEAGYRVHVEPKRTANWGGLKNVYEEDANINIMAKVLTVEPLVVQSLDTLVPTQRNARGEIGRQGTPLRNARLTLDPYVPQPETIPVSFGVDPKLAEVGDSVAIMIREDRPKVASRVTVRKKTVATSPAKRAADATATDGNGTEKPDDTKADEAAK